MWTLMKCLACSWILILIMVSSAHHDSGISCGFPGAPANGKVIADRDVYKVNETIRYLCEPSFDLEGPPINTCNEQGKWQNSHPPLCKQNAAYNSNVSQSSTLNGFIASLAIDGQPTTCAQTQFKVNSKNYWQIQMANAHRIREVSIRASVVSVNVHLWLRIAIANPNQGISYYCEDMRSRGTTSIDVTVNCDKQNKSNQTGTTVLITDERISGQLRLCEVKIALDEVLMCGKPDVEPHCEVKEERTRGYHTAVYKAKPGYKLQKGDVIRVCKNGKWPIGTTPLCLPDTEDFTATTVKSRNSSNKTSSGVSDKPLENNVIIGIAIGVTAASVSTIIIIVLVIVIMRKYYGRGPCRGGNVTSEHDGVFLGNHPSSCGSRSPTIHPNYSDPWDDPSNHLYDYINPETLLSNKNKNATITKAAETSFHVPKVGEVDRTGYLISRRSRSSQDADPGVQENLIEPVHLRNKNAERRRLPDPSQSQSLAPPSQPNSKLNSFNELEVDAYGLYGVAELDEPSRTS